MSESKSRVLASILLLAGLAPAQRVWIVDKAGGAGVDFTDIPPAIAAAQPGDTVRVLGGPSVTYSSFTLTTALNVEAPAGAACGAFNFPAFTVANLGAGSTTRVSGFVSGGYGSSLVEVKQCAGTVQLRGLGASAVGGFLFRVAISASAAVLVTDSQLRGYQDVQTTWAAVSVAQGQAILQRCTLTGALGNVGATFVRRVPGGPALSVASGFVVCTDCTLTGGAGANGMISNPPGSQCGTDGGNAVEGTAAVVLGRSVLTGGNAGGNGNVSCAANRPGSAASGQVTISNDAAVSGALSNGSSRVRSLAWFDSPGQGNLGGVATITVRGAPQTTLQVFLDTGFGVLPVPGFPVPYQGTAAPVYVGTFVLGAGGALPLPIPIPYYPPWSGWTFYFHALAFEPGTGALSCTNPGDLLLK